jgi:hypothetical protein
MLVTMVSQFDAFLGRLLRIIFTRKPEAINSSEKKISYEQLADFESIAAIREFIVGKEIESILRLSHPDQFKTLEERWSVKLTKDLACWPVFVELTERRNLFVHTDGIVSSQYLSACKAHNCDIAANTKEGDQLSVPQGYMKAAQNCIFEIGVKLGQVLWRKVFPGDAAAADENLTDVTFDLIDLGRFDLAIAILELATKVFKFASESAKLTATVNLAQSYKWSKRDKDCLRLLASVDWSAKGDAYKLADAVLREDWSAAQLLMRRLGKEDGLVTQANYRDWPLFQQFRATEEFLTTYKDIFGIDFQSARSISFEVGVAVEEDQPVSEPTQQLPQKASEAAPQPASTSGSEPNGAASKGE